MSSFPFNVYRIGRRAYEKEIKSERPLLSCALCGQHCGHTGIRTVRYETVWCNIPEKLEVIGENDKQYFIRVIYKDYSDRSDCESIETVYKEDCYSTYEEAEAEVERLRDVEQYL